MNSSLVWICSHQTGSGEKESLQGLVPGNGELEGLVGSPPTFKQTKQEPGRPLPEQTCTGRLSTSEQGLHSVRSGIFRPGHPRWLLAFLETLASGGGSEIPPPPSAVGPSSPLSPASCSEASRSPSNRPMKCLLVGWDQW